MKKLSTAQWMQSVCHRTIRLSIILLITPVFNLLPVNGQIQNLEKLANGKLQYSSILFDENENVYGYFYIFERDKEKTFNTMEYVFLDKNLNIVSNNEFKQTRYSLMDKSYYDCTLIDDKVILTSIISSPNGMILCNSFQIFSLKDKSVSDEVYYNGENFVKLPETRKALLANFKKSWDIYVIQAFANKAQRGFFITQHDQNGVNADVKEFKFFDTDLNQTWNYIYNESGRAKRYIDFSFLHIKGNHIYLLEKKVIKGTPLEYKVVALDFRTGEKIYEYIFETLDDEYSKTINAREVGNELIICGNYSPYDKKKDFQLDENMGFYRIILDEKGKEKDKTFLTWSDVADTLNIDERGRVDKDFRLQPIKVFFFNDKSISILTEKYKPAKKPVGVPLPVVGLIVAAATYSPERTTDFILFNLDKDMKLVSNNVIEKDLTKYNSSDYLFSQYIKDDTGVVFFYANDIKEKSGSEYGMILGINTIIDGKLTEEKIPIYSKKQYIIRPLPAKEGYIMLQKFNEKDKYNQIRLERLNY